MNPYDLVARYYDLEHEAVSEDLVLYRESMRVQGGPVLVVGVGTGRVAGAVKDMGEVWGVDLSEAMLARARERLEETVNLVHGDLRNLDLSRKFRLVLVPLDVFSNLTTSADRIQALESMRRHLLPEGLLIIDVVNPHQLPAPEQNGLVRERFRYQDANFEVTASDSAEVDLARQSLLLRLVYRVRESGGSTLEKSELSLGWVYAGELELLLRSAGLALVHLYGDYDRSPYHSESPRMIAFAVRQPPSLPFSDTRENL